MKIIISRKYYNGKISDNAPIYRAIQIDIDNNTLTLENEQYGDVNAKDYGRTSTKETLNLNEFLGENEKQTILDFGKSIKENYKQEFFEDKMPNTLSYHQITIDNETYKFGNFKCKDEYYRNVVSRLSLIILQIQNPKNIIKLLLNF